MPIFAYFQASYQHSDQIFELLANFHPTWVLPDLARSLMCAVVEEMEKEGREKGGAESAPRGVARRFFEEGVAKEGQKLGGGAHQGQSDWSKTTGVMDL
ncbi:hypothetical protein PPACK8108_LOCUS25237 [Phakopsora pachyrhizi]|uniref:Uncharacterized protein n=1 Tax=Phakopsora pachyrhizi TaxID=170000 RepID=A0AAV0BU94_PHAPC|nr:hypothetical protein PPACK8108_LOCUS25237 [Phakopsora pachyrhizi]